MAEVGKGGQGKKAPYESTHCRIPKPLKSSIEQLTAAYRLLIDSDRGTEELLEVVEAAISGAISPPQEKAGIRHREKLLTLKLERVTADRDQLLIRLSELQTRMMQEIKKAYEDANKKNETLESYNRQIDRANGYLEAENRKLRERLSVKAGSH